MARKNRHYSKRRRFGGLSVLYKLLSFVLICGAIAVAMALFFKAENIYVEGNAIYTAQQVQEASQIQAGDNLYLLNKFNAADRIIRALPYVEQVQIRRKLPNALVITVSECTTPAAVSQDGKLFLISAGGKIVDSAGTGQAGRCTVIYGVSLVEPQIGYPMQATQDTAEQCDTMLTLLALLQERQMLTDVSAIHLEKHDSVTMDYLERFTVVLPRNADWVYKLDYLLAVVDRLEANETGIIDMTADGTTSFIPRTKTAATVTDASPSDLTEPSAP